MGHRGLEPLTPSARCDERRSTWVRLSIRPGAQLLLSRLIRSRDVRGYRVNCCAGLRHTLNLSCDEHGRIPMSPSELCGSRSTIAYRLKASPDQVGRRMLPCTIYVVAAPTTKDYGRSRCARVSRAGSWCRTDDPAERCRPACRPGIRRTEIAITNRCRVPAWRWIWRHW